MFEVAVIEDPGAAEVALDPIRARLLAELAEPASATMLAVKVGLQRQKVNHHLKALGLAEPVTGAAKARQRIPTFAIDGEVRFASAADRSAFAGELANAVSTLVSKYHDATAEGRREHRVVVVHPIIRPGTPTATKADQDTMED
ncbi:MAG: ArsR family transcriptional regulator [Actinoallomurus sp.]|jgi:DNA-binding transcriptional ArsR family regulator|nr:ArsR family transcriptional regulator [Actinoallomurus sp.]